MTTSPSWFDQDKFSRLIKKVGAKPPSGQGTNGSAGRAGEPIKMRPALPVVPPSPNLLKTPQQGTKAAASVPSTQTKRPLPVVKPLFSYDEVITSSSSTSPVAAMPPKASSEIPPVREKPTPPETISTQAGPATTKPESKQGSAAPNEEIARLKEEREQARTEVKILREQLRQAEQIVDDRAALVGQIDELSQAAEERDQALTALADLVEINEALKREMGRPKDDSGPERAELEREIEALRQQLAEQEAISAQANSAGMEDIIETLKKELSSLREQVSLLQQESSLLQQQLSAAQLEGSIAQQQVAEAKEETTVAQRALALSQKTLQETRDALREASQGSATAKGDLDNLKNERSTLVQQNMLLQAQLDQVTRELSAAKAKASRG